MTSSSIARILNICLRKRRIAAGSDADIVVWDPAASKTITACSQVSRIDYNVFEGFSCRATRRRNALSQAMSQALTEAGAATSSPLRGARPKRTLGPEPSGGSIDARRAAPWFAGSSSNEHRALTGFDRLRAIRTSARSLPWPIPSVCPSSCRIFRCSPDRQLADIFRVFAFASHTPVLSNRWFSIGARRPSTKLYCSATPSAEKMFAECQKCTWQFGGNVPVL